MEEGEYPPRMYWRYAWRERVKAKLFSPYRAIPSVLALAAQFIAKHKAHTPFTEMWIAIAIVVAVYLGIFVFESLWSLAILTPPKIYGAQVDVIGELAGKTSRLEAELREPPVSPLEQQRRQLVSKKVKELGEVGRKVLRCIEDHGQIKSPALIAEYLFSEMAIKSFLERAIPNELVVYENHTIRINPELKTAIEFVLVSEYAHER
jgi:hypothetical protein